ncbi:hypothetical protein BDV18DRAFT_32251 [Aspergillus unguis]
MTSRFGYLCFMIYNLAAYLHHIVQYTTASYYGHEWSIFGSAEIGTFSMRMGDAITFPAETNLGPRTSTLWKHGRPDHVPPMRTVMGLPGRVILRG